MAFDDDDRRMLRDSVADFVVSASPLSRVRGWRERTPGWDRGFWRQIAAQGWTGLLVDEADGGFAQPLSAMAEVVAGLAGQVAPEPVTPSLVLAGRVLQGCGRGDLLASLAAGELVPALAWLDDAVPRELDAANTRTTASAVDGGWRLHGIKHHLRPGLGADGFIVSARAPDGPGLYWLPADSAGLTLQPDALTDGSWSARLTLADSFVPSAARLACGDAAVAALGRAIDEALVMASVELLALMRRMLTMSTDYLCTRQQFGKPIGSFQALQHIAVDLYIQQELSSALLDQALALFDGQATDAERAAMASRCKARCSDAAQAIARQAVQLHGAIGFTDEYDLGLFVQRTLVLAPWLGHATLHRRRFAARSPATD